MRPVAGSKTTDINNTTPKGTTTMAKTPTKLCQCYSEPVPGKPGLWKSCGRLSNSRFAPGHDAKLKGQLIRATLAGEQFRFIDVETEKEVSIDPELMAADLGWEKYTDRAKEVAAEKAKKAQAKAEQTAQRKAEAAAADQAKADKAKDKADKKAAAQANPPSKAKAAAKKVDGVPCKVKIGRWTYDGVIVEEQGDHVKVTYTRNGEAITKTVGPDQVTR